MENNLNEKKPIVNYKIYYYENNKSELCKEEGCIKENLPSVLEVIENKGFRNISVYRV